MAVLDNIVRVQISISQAATENPTFERMLILGTKPAAQAATAAAFAYYTSLDQILDAGWVATEDVYKAADMAFSNGAGGVYVVPYNSETSTALTALLDDALNEGGWYGLVTVGVATSNYSTISTWCETNHKLFGFSVADNAATLNPVGTTNLYTFGIAYDTNGTKNAFIHVAYMAKCFTYEPGTETWAYKTLTNITAGSYTKTQIDAIKAAGVNCYALIGGRTVTYDGATVSGEWIDVMRYCDYLASAIQESVYSLLASTVKVPYNAAGLTAIESAIRKVLTKGQSDGCIDGTDFLENGTSVPGFTVTIPDITTISSATRATRTLNGVSFSARLSGAVHVVEIVGTLSE